jgi:methylornithine synthase
MTVSGVHLIDLTMGEDPGYFIPDTGGLDRLAKLVKSVNKATGLPIMVSPGVVPDSILKKLSEVGATWYACYQETHNRNLFSRLRLGQSYDTRLNKKLVAHQFGLLIEEGLLCGVGESHDDVAESISIMQSIDADQVRVMKFIPQKGTPMEKWALTNSQRESLIIAVMRLVFPDRLIPVSLDVSGLAGLRRGLDAGANVVTSLVPPGQGLAGVAQSFLDIEDSKRTSSSVLKILETCSLNAGSNDNYISWIDGRRKALVRNSCEEKIVCSLP